jgi:hypothetical protein
VFLIDSIFAATTLDRNAFQVAAFQTGILPDSVVLMLGLEIDDIDQVINYAGDLRSPLK